MDKGWERRYSPDAADAALRRLHVAGALLSTMLTVPAFAAPPAARAMIPSMSGGESKLERLNSLRSSADPRSLASLKLDLRAPANVPTPESAGERPASAIESQSASTPSARRPGEDWVRARLQEDLPSLGTDAAVHPSSRAQQLAQRFRREGLPVARLFESRSALVSLGLNQRGKPGIWLIQKIP
jgi:hypothetical protein